MPRPRLSPLLSSLLVLLALVGCTPQEPGPLEPTALLGAAVVRPGDSIQAAIDAARPGTTILVMPGTYHEAASEDNALTVTKSGIRLIGVGSGSNRVVLENAGSQHNGVVVTPEPHCSACHSDNGTPGDLLPGADGVDTHKGYLRGFELRGFTITGFRNGIFTRHLEDFRIVGNRSEGNRTYGIFPTLSRDGLVADNYAAGANDSGIWIETSENVVVRNNLVEENVMGIEISNSSSILVSDNEARENSAGIALLLLPFLEPKGSQGITVQNNWVHNNNRPNSARPGAIASLVPQGTGIFVLAADDARVAGNRVENNDLVGIGIADYCLAVMGTDFDCTLIPPDTDPNPEGNDVLRNRLIGNGRNPGESPFAPFAADLTYLVLPGGGVGNCFEGNHYTTSFPESLPACP